GIRDGHVTGVQTCALPIFLAMDARHCAGAEMAEMMAYAAAVGSAHAKKVAGAVGFVGCAAKATAHYFGKETGLGTMPHALIGYRSEERRVGKEGRLRW